MKTVFLDFDGVLFDTLKEAYVLCRASYLGVDILSPVENEVYKLFYKYKFLVYNSWQYYYLMKILDEQRFRNDEDFISFYKECLNNRNIIEEENFDKKYYEHRINMMKNYSRYWDSLEEPFPFFNGIKDLFEQKRIDIVIVSKKNKFAINKRLKQYGLNLENDKIYAKEELMGYSSKAEFMHEYMIQNNIATSFFVDDNSNNLRPCNAYPEIEPLLAGWGNIAINEQGLTSDKILKILENN